MTQGRSGSGSLCSGRLTWEPLYVRPYFVKEVRQEARHEARQLARQLAFGSTAVVPSPVQIEQRQLARGLQSAESDPSVERKLARDQSAFVMSIFPVVGLISVLGVRPVLEISLESPDRRPEAVSACGSTPTPGTSREVFIRAPLT